MSVRAESLVQLLHGLNEVEISVADLDEDAKTCGITKELIKDIHNLHTKVRPMPQRNRAGGQKAS